jgi:hypothetical protein
VTLSATVDTTSLYHGPLEAFVARRTALARELRSTDAEAADAVAKLRKPSVSVWVIDQLAADNPDPITELLAAGADVRDVHRNVAAGLASREDLLAASSRLRDAVDAAARAANEALEDVGHASSEATSRRVRATLQAAATGGSDERRALWTGTLERDLDSAGFGEADDPEDDVAELAALLAPMRRTSPSETRRTAQPAAAKLKLVAKREAEREATNLETVAERARAAAGAKRQQADRMAEEARIAAEEASAAEKSANAADDAARAARAALDS